MGSDILTGNGAPSDSLGKNNDFYLDNLTGEYYQKFNGTWGSPVGDLTGPQGPTGPQGDTGPIGATGPSGGVASASNVGAGGVGVFKQLTGSNLEFKNINAGSSKISITNDTGNSEVDVDVVEANLNVGNMTGTLGETHGGTDQSTYTTGDLLYSSSSNNLSKLAIGAERDRLQTVSGIPAWKDFFDPTKEFYLYDSWVSGSVASSHGWVSNPSGTGSAVTLGDPTNIEDGSHQGILRLITGTTTSGRAVTQMDVSSIILGGGILTCAMNLYIQNLSDGTETYTIYVGLGNTTNGTEFTNGVYWLYSSGVNSGNWVGKTATSSSRTSLNTSVAAVASWQRLKFVVNAAASSVEYFINEASQTTITTNIPTTSGYITPILKIVKSAGTTSREINPDYFYIHQVFTATAV